jgi:hypothetical protein
VEVPDTPALPAGPERDFFVALSDLHHLAGRPTLREMAKAVGRSHTLIATVFKGPKVPPRFGLVELLVEYLHGDTEYFRTLWYRATGAGPEAEPPGEAGADWSTAVRSGPQRLEADQVLSDQPLEPGAEAQYHIGGDYVRGNKSGGDTIVRGGKHVYVQHPDQA